MLLHMRSKLPTLVFTFCYSFWGLYAQEKNNMLEYFIQQSAAYHRSQTNMEKRFQQDMPEIVTVEIRNAMPLKYTFETDYKVVVDSDQVADGDLDLKVTVYFKLAESPNKIVDISSGVFRGLHAYAAISGAWKREGGQISYSFLLENPEKFSINETLLKKDTDKLTPYTTFAFGKPTKKPSSNKTNSLTIQVTMPGFFDHEIRRIETHANQTKEIDRMLEEERAKNTSRRGQSASLKMNLTHGFLMKVRWLSSGLSLKSP